MEGDKFVRGQVVAVRRHSWSPWKLRMFLRHEEGIWECKYVCLSAQGDVERWLDCVPVQERFPEANLGVPAEKDGNG